MKKTILYIFIGFIAYAGFLVSAVPAVFVWQFVPPIKEVQVEGISGTVWAGQAREIRIQGVALNELSWEFKPSALLSARLGLDIALGHIRSPIHARGELTFDGKELTVENLFARSSLEHVQTMADIPVPADLSGSVNLNANQLVLNQKGCVSLQNGQLRLQQGMINSPLAKLDIGQVESSLSCNSQGLNLSATQQSEMFDARAQVSLNMNGRYNLEGTVTPTDSAPDEIVQGLSFIGEDNNDGSYNLRFNGRI